MDTTEVPVNAATARMDVASNEIKYDDLRPNMAMHVLPPSKRPMGRRLSAEETRPASPTINRGWIGMGWASGTIITLGAM
mmetsp:Transcript_7944/g.11690  ORF Transcript_7944/g.11690 Transcript_7944/m.11690 type:complete len:80 (-) Transcript_7944:506-745(-)